MHAFRLVLNTGNFFTNSGLVHVPCVQCNHPVHVNLIPAPSSHRSSSPIKLECLGTILESILDLPVTFSTYLNLQFLIGLNVEVYTVNEESKRELRGVVSLVEVLADFVSSVEEHAEPAEKHPDEMVIVEEKVANEKTEEVMTPRSRARMRIKEYRKKQRDKVSISPTVVVRINVDRSVSPPPGKPGGPASFRRRISAGNSQKSSPQSPPAPPTEKRPAEAAPRRVHRRSSEFSKP